MGQRSLQALESWSRASPTYHTRRTNSKTGKRFWELLRKGGRQWGRQRARKGMPVGAVHSTPLFAQGRQGWPRRHHQPGTRNARLTHPLGTSPGLLASHSRLDSRLRY